MFGSQMCGSARGRSPFAVSLNRCPDILEGTTKKQYMLEPEDYELLVGAASDDISLKLPLTITSL